MRHSAKMSKAAVVFGEERSEEEATDEAIKDITSSAALVVASSLSPGSRSSREGYAGLGSRKGFALRFS
ncbi:hypothetical protein BHM03_00050029 [Ensete ventricosum]|nr:hypothetical protein BHM03_00050029 [Ensete ventricosum]